MTEFDVETAEDFREALETLLMDAQGAGVPDDSLAGLLTVYLAALRGDVRLPVGVAPDRAEAFHDRFAENLGETAEFEVLITQEVLDDVDLQLEAFRGDDPAPGTDVDR
ncbi:MAG: hypothetical protein ABEJ23_01200 [Haloarculaceae archaeon]